MIKFTLESMNSVQENIYQKTGTSCAREDGVQVTPEDEVLSQVTRFSHVWQVV